MRTNTRKLRLALTALTLLALLLVFGAVPSSADGDDPNTVLSSTMVFEGALTKVGNAYTGTIPMINEAGTPYGDGEAGFDVYAKQGACAYVQGYYGITDCDCTGDGVPDSDTYIVGRLGNPHDAYTSGGPWGPWYDPDCADWNKYSLELTADHWYLRYTPTNESPMSGTMDWVNMYAAETDLGTQLGGHGGSAAKGGGPQAWDVDWGWGVEVIPLEFPGFHVAVEDIGSGNYRVTLTPAPGPVEEIRSKAITGSGTMEDTPTGGDVTIDAIGDHTITVAKYKDNPGGGHTFISTGYYDVHLDNIDNVTSVTIEFCPADASTVIYYWNGTNWLACSDQVFNAGTGCVEVTITATTDPNLDYLTGGPFASGYTPKPVGGYIVPVSKVELLAPYVGLAALMAVAAAAVVVRRRRA